MPSLAFVLVLLWGWPGGVSSDMRVSILEGRDFVFWGHQEPMCGLVWACIQAVMPAGFAVAAFFVVQTAVYWSALLLFAREALRMGSGLAAGLAVAAGFLPPLLCFSVMVESNIQSGVSWLAALAIAASVRSRSGAFAWVFFLWFGFVVRSGMIVALIPVALACLLLYRPSLSKSRALLAAIAVAITFQGLSFAVTKTLLGAPTRFSVLSVSQVFDMAAVYHETKVHHVPDFMVPEGYAAEDVLVHYEKNSVSGMFWRGDGKPVFHLPRNPDEGTQVHNAWLQTIREFPYTWLAMKVRYFSIFLMIDVEWAGAFWPDYGANADIGLGKPHDHESNPLGVYARLTATSLAWKGWFWFLVAGAIVVTGLLARAARAAASASIYCGAIGTLIPHFLFGQAALCRYYFLPYVLCVVSALVVLPALLLRLSSRKLPATAESPKGL